MGKTQVEEVVVEKTSASNPPSEENQKTPATPVVEEKKEEVVVEKTSASKGKKIKVTLLMDVHDGKELLKSGTEIELTDEELKRFHSSFYKLS